MFVLALNDAARDARGFCMFFVGPYAVFMFAINITYCEQYEEDVLIAVFGGAEGPKEEASQDSLLALVALPGYFVAVALIGRMGPRRMQVTYVRLGH